mmetsp:Transcript_37923/g.90715  ORF Transcript_37923/g.90715 Transcript_37923/m.90715 type:complete len:210 (-) Transcript_37923:37-666(-)
MALSADASVALMSKLHGLSCTRLRGGSLVGDRVVDVEASHSLWHVVLVLLKRLQCSRLVIVLHCLLKGPYISVQFVHGLVRSFVSRLKTRIGFHLFAHLRKKLHHPLVNVVPFQVVDTLLHVRNQFPLAPVHVFDGVCNSCRKGRRHSGSAQDRYGHQQSSTRSLAWQREARRSAGAPEGTGRHRRTNEQQPSVRVSSHGQLTHAGTEE